jgi:hypothetical protein
MSDQLPPLLDAMNVIDSLNGQNIVEHTKRVQRATVKIQTILRGKIARKRIRDINRKKYHGLMQERRSTANKNNASGTDVTEGILEKESARNEMEVAVNQEKVGKAAAAEEQEQNKHTNAQEEKTNAQEDKTNAQEDKTNAQEENIKEVPFDEWCEVFDPSSQQYYYQNLLDESVSQWELPEGFDPVAARKRVKLLMSCGSISELPHGLALLVACRKIQSVYRAKQARQRMRGLRAKKKSQQNLLATTTSKQPPKWTKCYDKQSGYHYYYNNSTGVTTWEKPNDFEG